MVSKRQSRIWGINKICSICYKSFLGENPIVKRCDECRKEDYFDNNTELTKPDSNELKKIDYFASTLSDNDLLYKEAEDKLLSKYPSRTRSKQLILDKFSDVIRNEVWE